MPERLVLVNQQERPSGLWWLQDTIEAALYYPAYLYERHIYERPSHRYRRMLLRVAGFDRLVRDSEELHQNGVVILRGYFAGERLLTMQRDFESWCGQKPGIDELGFKDFDGGKRESYLATSRALSLAAADQYLTALASYHWGKPIRLAYCHGYRLEPIAPREYRAFRWHHDLKRKQLRVMVLLTDTPLEGQRMDYVAGSHRVWHPFSNHRDVRFTHEEALQYGQPIHCIGPAGTVVVFDANGIHRGNRNFGPRRDQYTFNYTAGRALFQLPGLHPDVVRRLTQRQKRMLRTPDTDTAARVERFRAWVSDRFLLSSW